MQQISMTWLEHLRNFENMLSSLLNSPAPQVYHKNVGALVIEKLAGDYFGKNRKFLENNGRRVSLVTYVFVAYCSGLRASTPLWNAPPRRDAEPHGDRTGGGAVAWGGPTSQGGHHRARPASPPGRFPAPQIRAHQAATPPACLWPTTVCRHV